jgi:hypothetical protein
MLQASSVASSKIYLKPVSMLTLDGTARNSMQLSKLKQYTRSRGFAYKKERNITAPYYHCTLLEAWTEINNLLQFTFCKSSE